LVVKGGIGKVLLVPLNSKLLIFSSLNVGNDTDVTWRSLPLKSFHTIPDFGYDLIFAASKYTNNPSRTIVGPLYIPII